ncbi:protein asteroid-like [Pollicipes pollicipes]|uniref:protein asteroid-like n=1 Tax=Pollicipes pollicipes TaxID=41117 RepID=UPI001884D8F8|nr:protein asteroid-like [Pollicipes pollicipes]
MDAGCYAEKWNTILGRAKAETEKCVLASERSVPVSESPAAAANTSVRASEIPLRAFDLEQTDAWCHPVLLRCVFVEVLRRLGVAVVLSSMETDDAAAELAGRLNCPILSNDSDFFLLDVPCVRITPERRAEISLRSRDNIGYSMKFCVFRLQRLLEHCGVDSAMLGLVATLPGNDYFPGELFHPFFEWLTESQAGHTERRWCTPQQERLDTMLDWLAGQTSLQAALDKVLETLPEEKREHVADYVTTFNKSSRDEQNLQFLQDGRPGTASRGPARFHLAATHLHYELQYVHLMAISINALLNKPLPTLEVACTLNGPLA